MLLSSGMAFFWVLLEGEAAAGGTALSLVLETLQLPLPLLPTVRWGMSE